MNIFKNNFVIGVTAALAATLIAPLLVPAIKRSGRPLAKSLVKGGLALYEKGREAVANAGEVVEDVAAEIRAEQDIKQAPVSVPDEEIEKTETVSPINKGNNSHNGARYAAVNEEKTPERHAMEGEGT